MILSLPWTSWVLILVATVVPLGLAIKFYLAHRGDDQVDTHL
jgi:hypothetical protein